ncbi:23.6KD putative nonstructural protein [Nilaparvata lugens reovirus]|uniref:23.6KD putative nonstructural protein n=1 Tax=Nilaparvata lugens reovirus TaxID=33724 RepID=Q83866_9REOV|nr:23.6KD putative nonstructural protein [Nilaparvata lugens reovirus]BAA08550.1 23.6KD putative nonstructural protein [Nilaparvata lugens reovirus]
MTTRIKLKPSDYVFDINEMVELVSTNFINNKIFQTDETKDTDTKPTDVTKELVEIDKQIDFNEKKVESIIPRNNFAGIAILFIFRCIFACFKYAFNLGYYLGSFVCRRKVIRMSLGFIFGIFTNILLFMILYGFYLLYVFGYTMYFKGGDEAKVVTKESLDATLETLNSILRYAKMTHDVGLVDATERAIAEAIYPGINATYLPGL